MVPQQAVVKRDQGMQRKAELNENGENTRSLPLPVPHFEVVSNTALRHSARFSTACQPLAQFPLAAVRGVARVQLINRQTPHLQS